MKISTEKKIEESLMLPEFEESEILKERTAETPAQISEYRKNLLKYEIGKRGNRISEEEELSFSQRESYLQNSNVEPIRQRYNAA